MVRILSARANHLFWFTLCVGLAIMDEQDDKDRLHLSKIGVRSGEMPLFEIETDAHIIITWADDEAAAKLVVSDAYPTDQVVRLTKRPRDTWVISKGALGLIHSELDPCVIARECLSRSSGERSMRFVCIAWKQVAILNRQEKLSNRIW